MMHVRGSWKKPGEMSKKVNGAGEEGGGRGRRGQRGGERSGRKDMKRRQSGGKAPLPFCVPTITCALGPSTAPPARRPLRPVPPLRAPPPATLWLWPSSGVHLRPRPSRPSTLWPSQGRRHGWQNARNWARGVGRFPTFPTSFLLPLLLLP